MLMFPPGNLGPNVRIATRIVHNLAPNRFALR
jgi:hypothetical protein